MIFLLLSIAFAGPKFEALRDKAFAMCNKYEDVGIDRFTQKLVVCNKIEWKEEPHQYRKFMDAWLDYRCFDDKGQVIYNTGDDDLDCGADIDAGGE